MHARHLALRYRLLLAVLAIAVLAGALWLAVPGSARAARSAPAAVTCAGYTTGLTSGRESLHHWAVSHGSTIKGVLVATWKCGAADPKFTAYVNGGNDWRWAPVTRLWAPPVRPRCACPG